MKNQSLPDGVRETKKNYVVDLDVYTKRERYYTGTMCSQVLLISKAHYPTVLTVGYNIVFDRELDVIIDMFRDGCSIAGVKLYRKGFLVQ